MKGTGGQLTSVTSYLEYWLGRVKVANNSSLKTVFTWCDACYWPLAWTVGHNTTCDFPPWLVWLLPSMVAGF